MLINKQVLNIYHVLCGGITMRRPVTLLLVLHFLTVFFFLIVYPKGQGKSNKQHQFI